MRRLTVLLAVLACAAAVPNASAHGALTINEFDTLAISDFEGHEDSFPWEGFEIWNVYAGDGYMPSLDTHGVYFKANFAGDGSLRPTGSETWDLRFTFTVGNATFERTITHDGEDVTTDFERLDWQVADGNVFQIHAWAPVAKWEGNGITDLVVLSSVDGDPRDIAPGGIYDPATGQEVPVSAPATPVFPAMGEGRIVDQVPLTGAEKFLDVSVTPQADGAFSFDVTNPLAQQGQHVLYGSDASDAWRLEGLPEAESLDGGGSMNFTLRFQPAADGIVEPLRFDLGTDIGGLQTFYAFLGDDGVEVVKAAGLATATEVDGDAVATPGLPLAWILIGITAVAWGRRQ